jgi:hypothetical protein
MSTTASKMQTTIAAFMAAFIEQQDSKTTKIKIAAAWESEEVQEEFAAVIAAAVKTIKPKTVRAKKPADAPKKPKSAYMCFCMEERERIKTEKNETPAKEVMSLLGARWSDFKKSVESKSKSSISLMAKYAAQSIEDKDRYEAEMSDYTPSDESESDGKKKATRKKKDPKAPKGALSGYMFFCKDKRIELKEDQPELAPKEVLTEMGRMWGELKVEDADEVARYQDMADGDKIRYKEEMAAYTGSDTSDTSDAEEKPAKKASVPKPKVAPKIAPKRIVEEEGASGGPVKKTRKPAAKKPAAAKKPVVEEEDLEEEY